MRLRVAILVLGFAASDGLARIVELPKQFEVAWTAQALFRDMPRLDAVSQIVGNCGADGAVHEQMAYCTSRNVILYRHDTQHGRSEAYELAHLYGHAVQVRHGVADVALRAILSRRAEEHKLRGWVERQVDCIAGFIYDRAGLPAFSLLEAYDEEPLTGSHWGRDPLSKGPKVAIGIEARQQWFDAGYSQGLAACSVGEFGAELLLEALAE